MELEVKKSVVFIVDHLKGGGAELMVINLAKKLIQRHMSVNILLMSNVNNYQDNSINFVNLDFPKAWLSGKLLIDREPCYDSIHKMNEVISDINPDIVVVTIWYAYLLTPYISHNNLWVWSQADILPESKPTRNIIKKIRNNNYNKVFNLKFVELFKNSQMLVVNDGLRRKYVSLLGSDKIYTLPCGIEEIENFKSEKVWDVIFVGRLSPTKQIDHAILAFKKSGLQGKMLIVGDGPQKNKLEKIILKKRLQDQVEFIGWSTREEVINLISKSRVLVLPSRTEGFGLVIGEALMCGTPVVAYNCSEGVSSQLYTEDMKRGLVETNNVEKLAISLKDIIQNPYLIPDNIHDKYSLDGMVDKFLAITI